MVKFLSPAEFGGVVAVIVVGVLHNDAGERLSTDSRDRSVRCRGEVRTSDGHGLPTGYRPGIR